MTQFTIDQDPFSKREEKILTYWETEQIFAKSLEQRKEAPPFTFYDGPPFATGLPHYGHLLAGTIKDVIPRYKTMKGFFVPRRFGWDCHGLPVENEIEKAENLQGAPAIQAFGIDRFNEACRSIVLRYTQEWETQVKRMGRWVDFDHAYKTMDLPFMESVFHVFKTLWDKELIYKGYKVMPFSAKLGTPLSNFEAGENYKEITDPALTVRFALETEENTYFLAWTTTPWTLVANMALLVGPSIDYVAIEEIATGDRYILSQACLATHFPQKETYKVVKTVSGNELVGMTYHPPFRYFLEKKEEGAFRVLAEETVSLEDGTGIVHAAPAFGEVDFYACQKENIPVVCPVDHNGKFTEEVAEYAGLFVKDADKSIAKHLKEEGNLFHQGTINHRYPFCWRSDTPLIYKVVSTWFVRVEKLKERLLEANKKTSWTPAHLKEGRFGKWLEGARDWAISRNRYWGTPIPLWQSASGKFHVIGSKQELEELTHTEITDLHRHYIDALTFELDGEVYQRVDEVFDCWFESGSMPYASCHYPFENKEVFQDQFPADFIAEGLDQTRGWFYTLMVLSCALFDAPAFKNVIVNGIVLAEDGTKMSKRLKNYPDPMEVTKQYGADAIRLYLLHSPAVRAEDLSFKGAGVELELRQVLLPYWNAYVFFATYAKMYQWSPEQGLTKKPKSFLDRWILSCLHQLIHQVEEGMDRYHLQDAVDPLVGFIDQLTNWYIRRSRRRFWAEEATVDRDEAFSTLYQVLMGLTQVAAPFIPFITEEIYLALKQPDQKASVHLTEYPHYDEELRDMPLEEAMEAVKKAVSLGHGLRKEHKLKVRQPLSKAFVITKNPHLLSLLQSKKHLIEDELNVKEVVFVAEEEQFVQLQGKPNFRVLGKRVGKQMPKLKQTIEQLEAAVLEKALLGETVTISFNDEPFVLEPGELEVVRHVKEGLFADNAGELTVALDPTLTEELLQEGLAREIINKINTMRKEMGLHVSDRIHINMQGSPVVEKAFSAYQSHIAHEVLATNVLFTKDSLTEGVTWDLNGETATFSLSVDTTFAHNLRS